MADSTILVIDDAEGDQFMAKIMVESTGMDIKLLSAYDGEEALGLLEKSQELPNILLLDINMPLMDGYEFLAEYTKLYTGIPPIIAITSSSSHQADIDKTREYPCVVDYIVKPIQAEHIVKLCNLAKTL